MKTNEISPAAFFEQVFMLDPAAIRAQRQAELEQMAKYRAAKVEHYKQWSKGQKEYLEKYAPGFAETLEKQLKANEGKKINWSKAPTQKEKLEDPNSFMSKLTLTPISKPIDQKWYQRIFKWLP